MKNKNIYFVGYYLDIDSKEPFINAFDSHKKIFLENSISNSYKYSDAQYYPSFLYRSDLKYRNAKKTHIDKNFKALYRQDLRVFLGGKLIKTKSLKKNKLLFLRYCIHKYTTKYKGYSKLNIFNLISFLKDIKKQIQYKNQHLVLSLRKYEYRERFINGYCYAKDIIDNLPLDKKNDVFVLWGKTQSSFKLLLDRLEDKNVSYFFAEYGELPGTISISKYGIFGEYFSSHSWDIFKDKEVTPQDIEYTNDILEAIRQKQISTKSYGTNLYFLTKYFWEHSLHTKNRKKIIYVNGSELFISGFYTGRWGVDRKGKHPNAMLLESVVNYFDDNYIIIYKEHPMTQSSYKASLLDPSDFPTVHFIQDFNIHDILELADIVISFPSKVVITSFLYEKPTFVLGDFTFPFSEPSIRYFTSHNFQDIEQLLSNNTPYDKNQFILFITKMIKHELFLADDELFYNLDKSYEKEKITRLISKDSK